MCCVKLLHHLGEYEKVAVVVAVIKHFYPIKNSIY